MLDKWTKKKSYKKVKYSHWQNVYDNGRIING